MKITQESKLATEARSIRISLDAGNINIHAVRELLTKVEALDTAPVKKVSRFSERVQAKVNKIING